MTTHYPKKPATAVLIITYNAAHYCDDLCASLSSTDYPVDRWAIFIVDNNSTDDTLKRLQHYPWRNIRCAVIRNDQNLYFARGNNQAATQAIEEGYERLVLLNQDTVVDPQWLAVLNNVMDAHPNVGIVQARLMLWPPVSQQANSLGNAIHILGFGYAQGHRQRFDPSTAPEHWGIGYASGAAMMVRRSLWEELGGFDELLTHYHEDLDFGWRARLRGYEILCTRDAVVWHKFSAQRTRAKYYFMERNRILVTLKLYRLPTLILLTPLWILMELGVWMFALKRGWIKEKWRSSKDAILMLPAIIPLRRHEQRLRRCSDAQLKHWCTPVIRFQDVDNPLLRWIANPLCSVYWWIARRLIIW